VLARTQFGHNWLARTALALVLALALLGMGRRPALRLALFASAAMLAAGAWLGGLLPLALLFSRALAEPALLDTARRATSAFRCSVSPRSARSSSPASSIAGF